MSDKIRKQIEVRQEDDWIIASDSDFDRGQDRMTMAGAELGNFLKNPMLIWAHNYFEPWAVIGTVPDIQIGDSEFRAQIDLRAPASETDPMNIISSLWRSGLVRGASIGFIPKESKPNDAGGLDFLRWELLEISLCPIPENANALRMVTKSLDPRAIEVKTVVPHKRYPLADEGRAWDGDAARARLREWAGGDDWEPARYRLGFTFVDGEPDLLGSYKGPHHDIIDGRMNTIWGGVRAAMGSLVYGARGGRIADEGDRRGAYNHLAAHYEEFEKDVPEFRALSDAEIKQFFIDDEQPEEDESARVSMAELKALGIALNSVPSVLKQIEEYVKDE
jgi:hypothetical protein